MQIEIKNSDRIAELEIIEQAGSVYKIKVDNQIYEVDLIKVSGGVYSIIHNGIVYNVEASATDGPKNISVNTFSHVYQLEIVDSETKYIRSRNAGTAVDAGNQIRVPMPGKVVDVLVRAGDKVTTGQTLVIVAAMKMESEYKSGKEGSVKEVLVQAGDTVDSDQVMIVLE